MGCKLQVQRRRRGTKTRAASLHRFLPLSLSLVCLSFFSHLLSLVMEPLREYSLYIYMFANVHVWYGAKVSRQLANQFCLYLSPFILSKANVILYRKKKEIFFFLLQYSILKILYPYKNKFIVHARVYPC